MSTRRTVLSYFAALEQKTAWEGFLAETMTFTNFAAPVTHVKGKSAYLEATQRFFSMVTGVEVKGTLVEGEKACVLSHYTLQPPVGDGFGSDVAEILTVKARLRR